MRTFVYRHKQALFTFILAAVILAIAAIPLRLTRVSAQQPSTAESEQMRQMQAMIPVMVANMQAVMNAALAVLARKETADQMATFSKNYLDALVAKGFSREEALRLVAAHTPTIAPGMR